MDCCLKEIKTYKTSSIPTVNTDDSTKGCGKFKKLIFLCIQNVATKETCKSPKNFSVTQMDLFSNRFGDFFFKIQV